jgi:alpha-glucosidase
MPPQHDCILPFTRFVIGPGDYTPTVFNPRELRGFTWARELSQAIVFTSPFLCYADHPTNYLNNPAVDVLKAIPATWDETVVLPGSEIGKCAAFARRTGKQWFIGVINGGEATTLDFTLDFLGSGNFHMIQLGDAPDRDDPSTRRPAGGRGDSTRPAEAPDRDAAWQRVEKTVTLKDHVHLALLPSGGCVIQLSPQN